MASATKLRSTGVFRDRPVRLARRGCKGFPELMVRPVLQAPLVPLHV